MTTCRSGPGGSIIDGFVPGIDVTTCSWKCSESSFLCNFPQKLLLLPREFAKRQQTEATKFHCILLPYVCMGGRGYTPLTKNFIDLPLENFGPYVVKKKQIFKPPPSRSDPAHVCLLPYDGSHIFHYRKYKSIDPRPSINQSKKSGSLYL